jgi:hypothetical protein
VPRFYVRCSNSKCRARRVLKRHPETYERQPKCWSCGRAKWTIDPFMMKRDTGAMGCNCMGYNWGGIMHRRGSLHCWYNANGVMREVSEEEYANA